ncbi:hypothetical protein ACI2KR_27200 [Pseudomonas luteola]
MSEELKPCKTCGNENFELVRTQVWVDQGLEKRGPYCHCLACGSMFLAESKDWSDQVKAWNIRHEDKCVAELEAEIDRRWPTVSRLRDNSATERLTALDGLGDERNALKDALRIACEKWLFSGIQMGDGEEFKRISEIAAKPEANNE